MSDVYPDLDSLKRNMRRGRDYRIRLLNRKSATTLISPHGGFIEPGTSAIARAIAGSNHNLFDFQGLTEFEPFRLHVTSHRFRDPVLERILLKSRRAVSVHGMPDSAVSNEIWVGGLNQSLKASIVNSLRNAGFAVNASPPLYKGVHPENIVNLCSEMGVQIELPVSLRKLMFQTETLFHFNGRRPKVTAQFKAFVQAVTEAAA
jgi:phage replication-related protein YjqB (UPF0714/DUF867 family)